MKANRVVLDEQLRLLRSSYSTADFDAYADDDEEDAAPIPPRTISNVVKKRKYLLTVVKKMGWEGRASWVVELCIHLVKHPQETLVCDAIYDTYLFLY